VPHGVIDRAKWRNTLMYRVSPDLQVGVEYNPLAADVGPLFNLRVLDETRNRPALSFGTSSDRIGTPFGRAYYGTLSRDLHEQTGLPISLYAGVLWGSFDDEFIFPFGANVRFARGWLFTPQFDGHAAHGLVSYSWDRFTVTGMLVRWRHPGVAFNIGF
jgi:hypothetical protein